MNNKTKEQAEEKYSAARKVQDIFCESEALGFTYDVISNETRSRSIVSRATAMFPLGKSAQEPQSREPKNYNDVVPIDIVIPVFGPSPSLRKCLKFLLLSEGITPRITLIDNGTELNFNLLAAELKVDIKLIANSENKGFGGACDQGIKAAGSEIVVLLNSDAMVETDTVRILIDQMRNNDNIGISTATCLNLDGSIQETGRVLNAEGHSFPVSLDLQLNDIDQTSITAFPYASFVCVAIKRDAYYAVHGFDEAYFPAYSEDVDLCLRMWNYGLATVVSHEAIVRHELGESSATLPFLEETKKQNIKTLVSKHQAFFDMLPMINASQYPHEVQASRNSVLNSHSLIVLDSFASLKEILEILSLSREELITNSVGIIFTGVDIDIDNLRQHDDKWKSIEVYDAKRLSLHHWLRERIDIYEDIHLVGNAEMPKSGEVIELLKMTQPNAQWNFLTRSGGTQ